MTNLEKIRTMSEARMIRFLIESPCQHCVPHYNICSMKEKDCREGIRKWLDSEVKE